jgi:chromosome segregation ATPase
MPEPKMDQMGINHDSKQEKQEEYQPATFKIEKSGKGSGTTTDGLAGRILSLEQDNPAFKEALEVLDASDKWFPVEAETQDRADEKALELKGKLEDPEWQKEIIESAERVKRIENETSSIYGEISDLQSKIADLEARIKTLDEERRDKINSIDYVAAGYTLPRRIEDFNTLTRDVNQKRED